MSYSNEIEIHLKWVNVVDANNVKEAIDFIKEVFESQHNLDLNDDEIISVKLREIE